MRKIQQHLPLHLRDNRTFLHSVMGAKPRASASTTSPLRLPAARPSAC